MRHELAALRACAVNSQDVRCEFSPTAFGEAFHVALVGVGAAEQNGELAGEPLVNLNGLDEFDLHIPILAGGHYFVTPATRVICATFGEMPNVET